jgi:hypothetical protein
MSESQRRKRLQEAVEQATKELTDKGLLIEAGFASLAMMAFANAPADQVKFAREVFFAGAQHVFASIMSFLDEGEEPTADDLRRMSQISEELDRFGKEFAESLRTAGSA